MTADLGGFKAAVIGSGVFGLVSALRLALAGVDVVIYDPAPLGESASGVAAGMLAPAFESALDPLSAGHFPLLRRAREAWPGLLDQAGLDGAMIERSGAIYVGEPEAVEGLEDRLAAAGAAVERLLPEAAATLSTGLRVADAAVLFSPDDWRMEPGRGLAALYGAFRAGGGRIEPRRVRFLDDRWVDETGGELRVDAIVLAAGAEAAGFAAAAPELRVLEPIKGQILAFATGPSEGPVVRSPAGYIAPQGTGALVGATMEPGRTDRRVDARAVAGLRAEAERLYPGLTGERATARAGVRASTPDGLPLVGKSGGSPKLILAVGARRNGWLLAPLVAEVVVGVLAGEETGDVGAVFSPLRAWR